MTTAIRPFDCERDFMRLSNSLFDHVMPLLKPNAWKVYCFIVRKVWGFGKTSDAISYSQIAIGCGINSNTTIQKAVDELKEIGLVYVSISDGTTTVFTLNQEIEINDTFTESVKHLYRKCNATFTETVNTKDKRQIRHIHASACEDVSISTIPQPIPEQQISRTYAMEHGTSHDAFLLPSQKPNQRLVANAKGTTETERAMVLKFCELTGITLTKRTLATNISAAKDILASNATVDDIVSAWDESNRGVKWPVTSLFSLRGAAARLAGMRAIQSAHVVVADSDMVYTPSGRMVRRND